MQLNIDLLERITAPGSRLPWIKNWLLNEVWTAERLKRLEYTDYLRQGELEVNQFEILIASSADRIYQELVAGPDPSHRLFGVLANSDHAVVVLDGLSIREIPIIQSLASRSGHRINIIDTSLAALPSDTLYYIAREFPMGRISPSQLPSRKELKDKNIAAVYCSNINQAIRDEQANRSLLVWSPFPDSTYTDSGARFENHFENISHFFETVWMNTVQQIKTKHKIIITSDHGYIFFGSGMDFPRNPDEARGLHVYFGNDRWASLTENPSPPQSDDIYVDHSTSVASIKGRVRTRSTGDAASKLYKHGGLSLMEMITPWIEMER